MDKKEKVEFVNTVKVWDRIKATYEPRFLLFKGKPKTIEAIVGAIGIGGIDLIVPHPLGNGAELDRDNSFGWPCRLLYSHMLGYEVVGNYIAENFPEHLPDPHSD